MRKRRKKLLDDVKEKKTSPTIAPRRGLKMLSLTKKKKKHQQQKYGHGQWQPQNPLRTYCSYSEVCSSLR